MPQNWRFSWTSEAVDRLCELGQVCTTNEAVCKKSSWTCMFAHVFAVHGVHCVHHWGLIAGMSELVNVCRCDELAWLLSRSLRTESFTRQIQACIATRQHVKELACTWHPWHLPPVILHRSLRFYVEMRTVPECFEYASSRVMLASVSI